MEHLDALIHAELAGLGWPAEAMVKLLLAALAGGLVGLEREVRGRQAGFRTNLLVCVGSALVMIVSARVAETPWPRVPDGPTAINVDPARIAYGVMTGIGFLGAGVIVRAGGNVRGLTTAAGLWCVAAIGLAAGLGLYLLTLGASLIVLAALWLLDYLERGLPKVRYRVVALRCRWEPGCIRAAVGRLKAFGLDVKDVTFQRTPADGRYVDVEARVAFTAKQTLYEFEQKLTEDQASELMGIRET
jgi:putative Mg2+ transporter-C (MgtC) family protein